MTSTCIGTLGHDARTPHNKVIPPNLGVHVGPESVSLDFSPLEKRRKKRGMSHYRLLSLPLPPSSVLSPQDGTGSAYCILNSGQRTGCDLPCRAHLCIDSYGSNHRVGTNVLHGRHGSTFTRGVHTHSSSWRALLNMHSRIREKRVQVGPIAGRFYGVAAWRRRRFFGDGPPVRIRTRQKMDIGSVAQAHIDTPISHLKSGQCQLAVRRRIGQWVCCVELRGSRR